MQTAAAWDLVARPWHEELSHVADFGEYWRRFRLAGGYSLTAPPDPVVDGFLDCLSWYFGECVCFSGNLRRPEGMTAEDYRCAVEALFREWFPLFCVRFACAIAAQVHRPGDNV
ncbi:hypothetical protein [Streptomyces sp. NPDC085932]|uniref:hypothetical protein n=1 Tax=Streptomyces sp. NPDC085932 TaxID=3365741 RepID=UPI0037D2FA4B